MTLHATKTSPLHWLSMGSALQLGIYLSEGVPATRLLLTVARNGCRLVPAEQGLNSGEVTRPGRNAVLTSTDQKRDSKNPDGAVKEGGR